jgi:hypothetical protein
VKIEMSGKKWKSILLVSIAVAIVLLLFAYHELITGNRISSSQNSLSPKLEDLYGFHPYWDWVLSGGKDVAISEAQSKLPFKVVLPNNLGEPVLVKLIEENNFLHVIYSNKKLDPNMSFDDIIDSGAIVLTEYSNSSVQENDLMIGSAIEIIKKTGGVLEKVVINGHHGVYGGNIEHVLYWFIGTTNFEIIANPNISFSYLIEIADSIMGN